MLLKQVVRMRTPMMTRTRTTVTGPAIKLDLWVRKIRRNSYVFARWYRH